MVFHGYSDKKSTNKNWNLWQLYLHDMQSIQMQGRNDGGKRGTIPRAPNHHVESLWEAPKRPNNITSTSFTYSTFASEGP